MMENLIHFGYYGFAFLVVITVLVFVHEMGHFLVARWTGTTVDIFSIGMGPELFGWTDSRGTRWRVSAVPFGGYIRMLGDADISSSTVDEDVVKNLTSAEKEGLLSSKSLGVRMAISAAGPFLNFLLTIVLLSGIYLSLGVPHPTATVGTVVEGSPAAEAGLQKGDKIVAIDDTPTPSWEIFLPLVQQSAEQSLRLSVVRGSEELTVAVTPARDEASGIGRVGISPSGRFEDMQYEAVPVWKAIPLAVLTTGEWVGRTLASLGEMITGNRSSTELRGLFGIGEIAGDALAQGIVALLMSMAMLSMSLGLINLFPIPALDGGHLLFYAIEGLLGRPLSEKTQEWAFRIGLGIILVFFAYSNFNDLIHMKIFQRVLSLFS